MVVPPVGRNIPWILVPVAGETEIKPIPLFANKPLKVGGGTTAPVVELYVSEIAQVVALIVYVPE